MNEAILSVKGLSKTYDNGTQALKNISFEVKKSEFLVVIGLSGSGKSTLFRCLNRLHNPTAGQIIFYNQDVSKIKGDAVLNLRKKIGMIFQQFNLIPRYSVLLNVLTGKLGSISILRSFFSLFSKEDKNQALECLKLVGIQEKAYLRADRLSGGQQQRVAIARALIQKPEILLADEPVASLDPATCYVVMDYLKKVNQELGITIVCNLHYLSLVRQYATRVIALKEGELVFEGNPQEITKEWFKKIYGQEAREIYVS